MILNFYIRFYTKPRESLYVSGTGNALGENNIMKAVPLKYLNNEFWHGQVKLEKEDVEAAYLQYKYIFREDNGNQVIEWDNDRIIDLSKYTAKEIALIDTWNHAGTIENTFYTKPFRDVFLKTKAIKQKVVKSYTHEFRVKTPLLKEDEIVCILGSDDSLKNWDKKDPLLLSKEGNWWMIRINFADENFPVAYKYAVYNINEKRFIKYEAGNNRTLPGNTNKVKRTIVHDGFVQLPSQVWKAAGVAMPVFSLRSKNSFGTGEFTDIKLLVDWAKNCGLKMIQLLPINDTTATYTWKDSYPYAAISTFALHPLYLNLEKTASGKTSAIIKTLKKKQQQLNALPAVDYEEVMKVKFALAKELYALRKEQLNEDTKYFEFFNLNRHWLVPYAAFSYLRDKYKSADTSRWKTNNEYNEDAIQELVDRSKKHYDEIAIYYFIQYHLCLQLKEVTAYAHKNGVVIKGDLPIGIARQSADAWVNPDLYYMDKQAGAPPDDFAVKGQNWGFPTYNWKRMQRDDYTWWRQRFEQMGDYFDAFRIDHILGFFRIWSIPLDAVEGILGRFVPAIPIHIDELYHNGISFHPDRYCKPFINDFTLDKIFAEEAGSIKKQFLVKIKEQYELKPEFDTQRKVEAYFNAKPVSDKTISLKLGLFDLISNIIFIEEEGSNMQQLHFRIGMEQTYSFKQLDPHSQYKLKELYVNYFYFRQDSLWKKEALQKLPQLKQSTDMLVFGEDLGMVPNCVPDVMKQLGLLSLEIQRMPKQTSQLFFHPKDAPYLSLVTPATHDMSTLRGWWEEDKMNTQVFYNNILGHFGKAPEHCDATISKEIITQHLYSPAMWCVFQLQDILGMSETLRRENIDEERINVPANPNHYWQYRMHINLEDLLKQDQFNEELRGLVTASGR